MLAEELAYVSSVVAVRAGEHVQGADGIAAGAGREDRGLFGVHGRHFAHGGGDGDGVEGGAHLVALVCLGRRHSEDGLPGRACSAGCCG